MATYVSIGGDNGPQIFEFSSDVPCTKSALYYNKIFYFSPAAVGLSIGYVGKANNKISEGSIVANYNGKNVTPKSIGGVCVGFNLDSGINIYEPTSIISHPTSSSYKWVNRTDTAYYQFKPYYDEKIVTFVYNCTLQNAYTSNCNLYFNPTTDSSGNVTGGISQSSFNAYNGGVLHLGGESATFGCAFVSGLSGWVVKHWTINGSAVSGTEGKVVATLTLPASSAVISCVIEQKLFPITIKPTVGGIIQKAGTTYSVVSDASEVGTSYGTLTAVCDDTDNYKFVGWYVGVGDNVGIESCSFFKSDSVITIVNDCNSAVTAKTYYANFVSTKNSLTVKSVGSGKFSLSLNGTPVSSAQGVTSYTNNDVREGWRVALSAVASTQSYYFSKWTIPDGATGYKSVTTSDVDASILSRDASIGNVFTATFVQKKSTVITGEISGGNGSVDYSGGDIVSGSFSQGTTYTISGTSTETAYAFVANDTSRLYKFSKWQYKIGSAWSDITTTSKPVWVSNVENNSLFVTVPDADVSNTHAIRALYVENKTYTVATPVVEGSHPISGDLAVNDGCTVSALPTPDKGTNLFVEGASITLNATTSSYRWKFKHFELVVGDEHTYNESSSITFEVSGNTIIKAVFEAVTYKVSVSVNESNALVCAPTFTYYNAYGELSTAATGELVTVYVDTKIVVSANIKDTSGINTTLDKWEVNDSPTGYTKNSFTIDKLTSDALFECFCKTKHTFNINSKRSVNGSVYYIGEMSVTYNKNGAQETVILPTADDNITAVVYIPCGETYNLTATPKDVTTTAGTVVHGFFAGWFNGGTSSISQIVDWGQNPTGIVAGASREITAKFTDVDEWPILRLRNLAGSDVACSFSVTGVRPERSQTVGSNTIYLTNPLDFFCDNFATVSIVLTKSDKNIRFVRWESWRFDLDNEETNVVDQKFSDVQDLSVIMSTNLYLRPVFNTGVPSIAKADFATGSDLSNGFLSVDGDAVSIISDSEKSFVQEDDVTFAATPTNGYKFAGWYSDKAGKTKISDSPKYTIKMGPTTMVLYAMFVKDTNAIYTFDTGRDTKRLVWCSKQINANTPTSFSTIQVDAENDGEQYGANVVAKVFHSSSPNVPYKMKEVQINDCNSRRIAMGSRPEKCFKFEVDSTLPINFFAVGTSVSSLIGGNNGQ